MNPSLYDLLFFSTVPARLDVAQRLHRQLEALLSADPGFLQLQEDLRCVHAALAAQMVQMELGALCSRCGSTAGGCCSSEMAGETDAVQILINLMAGVDVRIMQSDEEACCFLGTRGCIFFFKPMFCLNYNCSHISRQSGEEQMQELETQTGRLLSAQYRLESYLLEEIAAKGLSKRK